MINIYEYLLSKQNNEKTTDSIVKALSELKDEKNALEKWTNTINKYVEDYKQYEDYYNMLIGIISLCGKNGFEYVFVGGRYNESSKMILNYEYQIKGDWGLAFEFIDVENVVCTDVIIDKFKVQIITYSGFDNAEDYLNSINGNNLDKKPERKIIFDSRKKKDPFDFDDILKKELFKQ